MRTLTGRLLLAVLACLSAAPAATLRVGPGQTYARPCLAFASAKDGDTIEIDAGGDYSGDVCSFAASNLLIRGVNGRPRIDAAGRAAAGKGVWVVQGNNNIVDNVEILGATVPDRNGAAIRFEGVNLTLRRVYFHHNENGMLTVGRGGDILIEYSEFDLNGDGSGSTHNLYVNYEHRLTVRFSYFHRAHIGNVIKSRAAENYFFYNRFASEDGTSSWEVDLPNGGTAVLVGNVIQQGPLTDNINLVSYLVEGAKTGYSNVLLVSHNTLINEGPAEAEGTPSAFIYAPAGASFSGLIANNIFAGPGLVLAADPPPGLQFLGNIATSEPLFAAPASGDYRLLDGAPVIAKAEPLPDELAALLTPLWQNQPAVCGQRRPQALPLSPGAFEYGAPEVNISDPCVVTLENLSARVGLSTSTVATAGRQTARVILDGVAPPGGAQVSIQYSHPNLIQGPSSVTIPAGEPAIPIELSWTMPETQVAATLTAVYQDQAVDAILNFAVPVVIQPAVSRIALNPSELTGGASTSGNFVSLNVPAPAGGAVIALVSSQPDLVTVPSTISVPSARTRAAFTVSTRLVTATQRVTITASWNGSSVDVPLTLNPVTLGNLVLPGKVLGGPARHTASLRLTGPAPAGGLLVQLSSTAAEAIQVPASILVPEGRGSVSFDINIAAVSSPVPGEILATLGDAVHTVPVTASQFSISALQINPAITTGGLTSGANRVVLNSPAPASTPIVILLSSSNPALAGVPGRVTIQPGFASAPFQVVTTKVTSLVTVDIRALAEQPLGGVSDVSATVTLRP